MDPIDSLLALEQFGIKFGLNHIQALCAGLDHPERSFRSVIIAGTNGKGSVAAMAETALRASGRRTGRYTSPHLVRLEERFAIDGRPVGTAALREAAGTVMTQIAALRASGALETEPTFFEAATAVAFDLFRRAQVDVAVLEVGLGGRLDATNVVTPLAAAITTIDFDHERYLGTTLAAIAFEKAGVIKPGMTVVVGERKPEALDVIARACRERGATLVAAAEGVTAASALVEGATQLTLRTPAADYGTVRLGLAGAHQVANAVTAVRLLEALARHGLDVPPAAVVAGLRDVRWPGRLDWRRLDAEGRVLLDAAHNPAGAAALAAYLGQACPGGLPIVFGVMRDKDVAGMLAALLPCATHLFITRPAGRRAMAPADIAALVATMRPARPVTIVADPVDAVRAARAVAGDVCAAGSIFLLGEILAWLDRP